MKIKKLFSLLMMAALVLSLVACGNSASPSTSTASTPAASTQASAPASTQASSPASTQASKPAASKPAASKPATTGGENLSDELKEAAEAFSEAFMGVSEAGEAIFYAGTEDNSLAILVFYDVENNESVSFVGPMEVEENYVTITDLITELSFTFSIELADEEEGAVMIDTGSGYAILVECSPLDVLEAAQAIEDYSDVLA